jgi:hypothetical protein
MTRLRLLIAVMIAILATPAAFVSPAFAAATDLLPDMRMAPLYGLYVETSANGRKKLRFGTIGFNVGDGPLEVRARNRDGGEMLNISQWIYRSDGTSYRVPKPDARMFYAGDGHDHWHLERFMVVRLKPNPGTTATERRIRKIGYCLVDSVAMAGPDRPPNTPNHWVYGDCGTHASRRVTVGISVGWGDNYPPQFAFQSINVTGLPVGSYRLCATVNPTGIWTEKNDNYTNNSYWMDLDLDAANNAVTVTDSGATPCS